MSHGVFQTSTVPQLTIRTRFIHYHVISSPSLGLTKPHQLYLVSVLVSLSPPSPPNPLPVVPGTEMAAAERQPSQQELVSRLRPFAITYALVHLPKVLRVLLGKGSPSYVCFAAPVIRLALTH